MKDQIIDENEPTPIKSRVYAFIEAKGIKKKTFFTETGISSSNFRGRSARSELGGDKIYKIVSKYPDMNPEWLLTGKGEMLKNTSWKNLILEGNSTDEFGILKPINTIQPKKTPLVNRYAYTNFILDRGKISPAHLMSEISWDIEDNEVGDHLLTFEQVGDAMMGNGRYEIMDGDFVLGRKLLRKNGEEALNGHSCILVHPTEGILIRRISIEKKQLICWTKNASYKTLRFDLNEVIDIYKVIKLKRDFRY